MDSGIEKEGMERSWILSEEPEGPWVENYYDALQFYYHEPQHLRKRKKPNSNLKSSELVDEKLRRLEVPLNHQIKQFLSLAPNSLRKRLFDSVPFDPAPKLPVSGKFILAGRHIAKRREDGRYVFASEAQPDLLFKGVGETVSLEMKIDAKSGVDQVLKYALLALALELDAKVGAGMEHFLILLAKRDFSKL